MPIEIGIGLGLGRLLIGAVPTTPVPSPPVVVQAQSSLVAVPSAIVSPTGPLAIVTSRTAQLFLSADVGVSGASVATWNDQSGQARHGTAAGSAQPSRQSAALNGKNTVLFDAVDDNLVVPWIPPAPGTTPTFYWWVFRTPTITNGLVVFTSGSGRHRLAQSTTNRHSMSAGTATNLVTSTPNTWYRGRCLFNNGTTDYLRIGATTTTGANAGNNAGATAFYLGSNNGATPASVEFACFAAWNGEPTAGELTALDAWVASYYGAGVGL